MKLKVNVEELVGINVRGYRKQLNISQSELAELADLQTNYVGEIERAEKTMSIVTLWKLAYALGIDPGLLLSKESYKAHKAKARKLF